MIFFVISVTAFLAAMLTFFSGFGLGTLLSPVFMLFFSAEEAIALTGVVHFFNNIFKLGLVGRDADRNILKQFGIPAIIFSFIGSYLLVYIADLKPLFEYSLYNKTYFVYPVKFIVAILLIIFALIDLFPFLNKIQFGKEKLALGGALSGFFGGLSGNQGALRSAFLVKAGLRKEAFVATGVVVSTCIDFTRLGVYATRFSVSGLSAQWLLVLFATVSAILGAYLGNKLLKKVTFAFVQIFVAVFLFIMALALGAGFV